jgi:hypothetical protein
VRKRGNSYVIKQFSLIIISDWQSVRRVPNLIFSVFVLIKIKNIYILRGTFSKNQTKSKIENKKF